MVDDEFEIVGTGLLPDDFDNGVGVGDGGGLGGGDYEDFAGGDGELDHLSADAGGGVDEHEIGGGADAGNLEEKALHGFAFEIGEVGEAGGAGNDLESIWAGDDDFLKPLLALDDVIEVELGIEVEEKVDVGEAHVSVDDDDVEALAGVVDAEVGDEGGFADAAFAAGDGDDAGVFYLDFVADADERAKVSGLIGHDQGPEPWAEAGTSSSMRSTMRRESATSMSEGTSWPLV